ncbi:MAG: 50S ribosomal protein L11 methyltransferase [Alphaproteobacteria bacterium]|nr:50S ribosomal protein L11 methyltransferase [Alphaproteobacteria bacterium]
MSETLFTARIRATLGEVDGLMAAWEELEPAPLAVSAIEVAEDDWRVEALYRVSPDKDVLAQSLKRPVDVSGLQDQNWVKKSLDGLRPVRAGRFVIHGSHDKDQIPPNLWRLEIEASLAFGTGHHGTTRGCLLAIDALLKQRRFRRPLDVGCGSGVLGLAVIRARHIRVRATDIDGVAAAVTNANAKANGLGRWMRAVRADGLAHQSIRAHRPYDLILANILARPLIRLSGDIERAGRKGTVVVLAGLLSTQARAVFGAYHAKGHRLLRRLVLGEWTILILERR